MKSGCHAGVTASVCAMAAVLAGVPAGSAVDRIAELRRELEAMYETDQAQRQRIAAVEREHGANSPQMAELWRKQTASDHHNIGRLEEIIAEIGWPKRSAVGERAANAAFLILQHSDLSYQKKYLPLARSAVAGKEMRASSLALLEDRILLREGKQQIYGSQVRRNEAGEWEAMSLEDPEHVDERRAAVGLPPLAEYLAGFARRSGGKVADRSGGAPLADAPPLRQDLFAAGDDARVAYEKLQKAYLASPQTAGLALQLACHDFCLRFPDHPLYGAARILAVRGSFFLGEADLAKLADWNPTEAERDPKLNPEQRAEVALTLAFKRAAARVRAEGGDWAERQLEAVVAALPPHQATQHAKQTLIRVALEAPPARAIPVLREAYPGDAGVAEGIRALEAIGGPCELAFTAFDGRAVDLREFRGRVVLIAFFAGSGGSSEKHLSQLRALAERHGAENLAVLGVSFDRTREAVQEVITRHGISWPVHFDGQGWSNALGVRFHVRVLPAYLLIDRQGVLRFRGGAPTSEGAERNLALLLAAKPATDIR
jgi:peroxiredoxin